MTSPLNLRLFAEESLVRTGNGVHTALHQLGQNLVARDDIRLAKNNSDSRVDVLHAHTVGLGYLLKSFKHGDHLIVSAHVVPDTCMGSLRLDRLCRMLARAYLKLAYNRARLVIAVSPYVKRELEEIGVKSEIVVLCNSVDREEFKPDWSARAQFRESLDLSSDDFVVVCVGQLVPRKGVHTFIAVAKVLPEMKFVWVGGRPFGRITASYERITRLVNDPPHNVIFTGLAGQEQVRGYYGMSDVFLFPSYQEGFSYAILEASSMKLPLLLRDNPTYPGYLFAHYLRARDTAGFAEVLKRLHEDQAYLEKWKQEADILASKYEISGYVDRLVACYGEVAGIEFS